MDKPLARLTKMMREKKRESERESERSQITNIRNKGDNTIDPKVN